MRIEFLDKLICYGSSLPSRTKALQELSMSVGRLEPQQPLSHMIAMCRRAKLILVRMYVIAFEYDSSFFSAILAASYFKVHVADGHAPQIQEVTSGTKLLFSTSSIRYSYLRHFNKS